MLNQSVRFVLLVSFLFGTKIASAWVYPEHRQIALLAIQNLSADYRSLLDKLWWEATADNRARLTQSVIDPGQGLKPLQLDFAAWTAIAGDHSCSPENLLNTVLKTQWILEVADIAARLQADIAGATTRSRHLNAIRNSDIRFQAADPEYATRAGSNNVHFLLSRPELNTTADAYIAACLLEGAPLNALGAYSLFHTRALAKARKYATENSADAQRSALILSALADEAFALHFLEDVYAAGHIAGTWGDASLRKGTHDYYNEKGLEVVNWEGSRAIVRGDAFITTADAEVAATSVRLSLEQLIKTASGQQPVGVAALEKVHPPATPDTFNVCTNNVMPPAGYDTMLLGEVLKKTPVPGLATGAGELPRFRAELGPFVGMSAAINGAIISGGFGSRQNNKGFQGGLEANIRAGFGLDGVLNQAGDGLVFLQVGWRQDAASTNKFLNLDPSISVNSISAAIPGRSAYNLRLRLPFWLIPGDLLVLGPALLLAAPAKLPTVAVAAANGGLIPWQAGIATGIGRFQFVLGREVGVSFYGIGKPKDVFILPAAPNKAVLLEYRSTKLDFPIVEFRPLRTFSQDQSSSIMLQLNAGVDLPAKVRVVLPVGEQVPQLKNVWYLGLRVLFNWRQYL